ncbi:MAG: SDR family NAD(P)-dependent oxidoreductase, partial [Luteibacter sp.]
MTHQSGETCTADDVLSDVELRGKRFLITGVSSGVGVETARSLVARGATVVGTVRDVAKATEPTAPIRDAARAGQGTLALVALDLASLASVRECADKLLA